jgi:hypothetical protein
MCIRRSPNARWSNPIRVDEKVESWRRGRREHRKTKNDGEIEYELRKFLVRRITIDGIVHSCPNHAESDAYLPIKSTRCRDRILTPLCELRVGTRKQVTAITDTALHS